MPRHHGPGHDRLLVIDIETVPDRTLLPPNWGTKFPKPIHHRIVCLSYVEAEITLDADGRERYAVTACRSGGEAGWDERRLLEAFWAFFSRRPSRLVTWNGRSFDLPVLVQRTMVHGLTARGYFEAASRFDSYTYRYAADRHCDLMDVLADHGASTKLALDEAAVAVGLPGKIGGHGSGVEAMVEAGEIDRVRAYCEGDVLNLYQLYARYGLLAGRMTLDGYRATAEDLGDYLGRERGRKAHFGAFLDLWKGAELPDRIVAQQSPIGSANGAGDARQDV